MAEISVEHRPGGGAYVRLGGGEARDLVVLGDLQDADRIPALDALVLHFDFYGRLIAIEVTESAQSVLPPALLEG